MLILIVGESMTGKSVSAATFPKPMKYFDFDGNRISIFNAKDKDGNLIVKDADEIEFINMTRKEIQKIDLRATASDAKSKGLPPTYSDSAAPLIDKLNKEILAITNQTITVVMDSFTSMFRLWKDAFLFLNKIPQIRIQDYQSLEGVLFSQFIPSLKALPCQYVVCVDHTDIDKDEIVGTILEFPVGPSRNMGRQLGKAFDEVWLQRIHGGEYEWKLRAEGFFGSAGSRLHLPPTIKPPTFYELEKYLKKEQ